MPQVVHSSRSADPLPRPGSHGSVYWKSLGSEGNWNIQLDFPRIARTWVETDRLRADEDFQAHGTDTVTEAEGADMGRSHNVAPWLRSSRKLFVWRPHGSGQILRIDPLNIEPSRPLPHCFENLFEWRFVLNPSQRVDTRHHKRAQVLTDQTAVFQLLHHTCNLLFEIEHHTGARVVVLDGGTKRFFGKSLKSARIVW